MILGLIFFSQIIFKYSEQNTVKDKQTHEKTDTMSKNQHKTKDNRHNYVT